jgi:hypothetical protein
MTSTTGGFQSVRSADPVGSDLAEPNYSDMVDDLWGNFNAGHTRSVEWRMDQLNQIVKMCQENTDEVRFLVSYRSTHAAITPHCLAPQMIAAIQSDLRRPAAEALLGDVAAIMDETKAAMANLSKWMEPEVVKHPLKLKPGKSMIVREPKGVCLIIGPWNFPIQLLLNPLIGAIAAGNCAVLKPSEVTPACANLVQQLVEKYLDRSAVRIVQVCTGVCIGVRVLLCVCVCVCVCVGIGSYIVRFSHRAGRRRGDQRTARPPLGPHLLHRQRGRRPRRPGRRRQAPHARHAGAGREKPGDRRPRSGHEGAGGAFHRASRSLALQHANAGAAGAEARARGEALPPSGVWSTH